MDKDVWDWGMKVVKWFAVIILVLGSLSAGFLMHLIYVWFQGLPGR